jgi:hypothetical protein
MGKNATARALAGQLGLPPGLAQQPLVRQLREEIELMAPPVRGLPARVLAHCLCSAE